MPPRRSKRHRQQQQDAQPRRRGPSIATHAASVPPILRTNAQSKAAQGGHLRGVSIIGSKAGGNYSLDPRFGRPPARAFDVDHNPTRFTLLDFLKYITEPTNLEIIRKEYAHFTGRAKTSPSLHTIIEIVFFYMPRDGESDRDKDDKHPLDACRTAWSCLFGILKELLTPATTDTSVDDSISDIAAALRPYMQLIKKLIEVIWAHNPTNERTNFSKIRTEIIRTNWSPFVSEGLKTERIFEQKVVRKKQAAQVQEEKKSTRVVNQTTISFKEALNVGIDIVKQSRDLLDGKAGGMSLDRQIHTLISTVMYCTGSRLTEVVILSKYKQFSSNRASLSTISNNLISKKAPMLTIDPVAKERDPKSVAAKIFLQKDRDDSAIDADEFDEFDAPAIIARLGLGNKTSDRVILFGATRDFIDSCVTRLRALLVTRRPRYARLDKTKADDRKFAITNVGDLNAYVDTLLRPLNQAKRFTARAFRGLYVALSYRLWAKQPTSEIMWINTILAHANITTSVSYNVYSLTRVINVLDRKSVDGELTAQQARIDKLEDLINDMKSPNIKPPTPLLGGKDQVLVSKLDNSYEWVDKEPHLRDGREGKLRRILARTLAFHADDIITNTFNLRAVGFSSDTIKQWRESVV